MPEEDKSNQLRVISFEPHLVQIEIIDFEKWKEENSGGNIKIGSFLKIEDGNDKNILVLVKSFKMKQKHDDEETASEQNDFMGSFIINTQPIGQLEVEGSDVKFIKGIKNISIPPSGVSLATKDEIKNIFSVKKSSRLIFAEHLINPEIKIEVDGDKFFSKHIAVVGSTGSGKSCTVAKIIQEAKKIESSVINNSHILIFDIHGEYKKAFPESNFLSIENDSLKLPYWLMNSEELEDMFIESNESNSHNQVSQFKYAVIENKKKHNPSLQITYDSPVYFSIKEVINYIHNRNIETVRVNKTSATENSDLFEDIRVFEATNSKRDETKISSGSFYGEFNRFL